MKPIATSILILSLLFGGLVMGSGRVEGPNLGSQLRNELIRLLKNEVPGKGKGVVVKLKFRISETSRLELLKVGTDDALVERRVEAMLQDAFLSVDRVALGKVYELTLNYVDPDGSSGETPEKVKND